MNGRLIGEIFGAIAIVESFFVYYSSTRSRILIFKFIADLLWVCNFLCLGAFTGAIINFVAMGREAVFYNRDRHPWAGHILWLFLFMAAALASPVMSLVSGSEGWYAVLPAIGSALAVIGFYQREPQRTRFIGFFAQAFWLAYALFCANISATVSNSILLLSAVLGAVRAVSRRRKAAEDAQGGAFDKASP